MPWRWRRSPMSPCSSCAAKPESATTLPSRSSPRTRRLRRTRCCALSEILRRTAPHHELGRALMTDYPRDMVGYGQTPPTARWPNGARLALQIVLNYEEGGENNIL